MTRATELPPALAAVPPDVLDRAKDAAAASWRRSTTTRPIPVVGDVRVATSGRRILLVVVDLAGRSLAAYVLDRHHQLRPASIPRPR